MAAQNMTKVLKAYKVDVEQSVSHRLAHFLDYCATQMPKRPIPWTWTTKIVTARPTMPHENSKDIELLRDKVSHARKISLAVYKRGIVTMPGQGVRATTDDDDLYSKEQMRNVRRLKSATNAVVVTDGVIDKKRLSKTNRAHHAKSVGKIVKMFETNSITKLLEKSTEKADPEPDDS